MKKLRRAQEQLEDATMRAAMTAGERVEAVHRKTWWMEPMGYLPIGGALLAIGALIVGRMVTEKRRTESDADARKAIREHENRVARQRIDGMLK